MLMRLVLLACRYLKNGWSISTVAPNKGLATQLKKLIISTSTKVNGESFELPACLYKSSALFICPTSQGWVMPDPRTSICDTG